MTLAELRQRNHDEKMFGRQIRLTNLRRMARERGADEDEVAKLFNRRMEARDARRQLNRVDPYHAERTRTEMEYDSTSNTVYLVDSETGDRIRSTTQVSA